MTTIKVLGRTKVRHRLLRSWVKARQERGIPSLDYDDLCLWYSQQDGTILCSHCPLKDCESPKALWVKAKETGKDEYYNEIIRLIALWLEPREAKTIALTRKGMELDFITMNDIRALIVSMGGPSAKGLLNEAYIRALKEWIV